jgi:hypothetical protein
MIEFALVYMIGTVIINQTQTFNNVNDCLYFAKKLNDQPEIPYPDDSKRKITAYCKPVPKRLQNKK